MSINATEGMLAGNANADILYPDADPTMYLIWIKIMLILMLNYVSEVCLSAVARKIYG